MELWSISVAGPTKKDFNVYVLLSFPCSNHSIRIELKLPSSISKKETSSINNNIPQKNKALATKSNPFNGQSILLLFFFLLVLPNSLRFLQPGRQVPSPILSILILPFLFSSGFRVSYLREFIFSGKQNRILLKQADNSDWFYL